ncbi:MAG TPA: Ig-like domain-containing protein, partial [Vicinamibacterales bacterium]
VSGVPPTLSYLSGLNYNGPDSFKFRLHETSTWNGLNQMSDPATVAITVTPVNDKPSFTHAGNQSVTQPVGAQTVAGWVTGFDAGPPDEDASQTVAEYIVSNNNPSLFSAQPAVAVNGTLTYTPAAGASGVASVTVRVRDTGGTAEGHGAVDTSDAQVFTITINAPPATQIAFQRTDVWMSTSSSNRKYDLKAEVLKNGVVVKEKIILNQVLGFGTTFNKALYVQISAFAAGSVPFLAADTLSVRVSVRVSDASPGGNSASGEIRLWYNIPSPPANTSHLHATRGQTDVKYYMVTPFTLRRDGSVAGPTQSISAVVKKTTYTVIGTWSITGP